MRNEKTQSGERNMLHTLFTIFIFFFSFFSTAQSFFILAFSTAQSSRKTKKKKRKRRAKKKKSHSRSSNGGMRPFWGRDDLPTCSPYHHRGTAMEYCYTPRRIRNEIFYRKDGREVGANYGLDSSA